MKKKNIALIVTAALALTSLVGCNAATPTTPDNSSGSELTVEAIAKGAADALNAAKSISTSSELDFSGSFSYSDTAAEIDMTLNTDAENIISPAASHVTQKMKMSYLDQSYDQTLEFYTVEEDGTSYVYTGSDGIWVKSASTDEDTNFSNTTIFQKIADGEIDATLDSEKEDINGREAYEMTLPIAGDYLEDMIGFSLGESLADSLSFAGLSLETSLYVYTDTLEPACVSISCEELGESLFEKLIGLTGVDFSVDDFEIDFTYNSFNNIDEITVPDDVKAAAAESTAQSTDSDVESSPEVQNVQKEIENTEKKSNNGDVPTTLELTVGSDKISVPLSYSSMVELGWTISDSADGVVATNDYDYEYMTKDGNSVLVYIYNPSSSEASYDNCEIISIDVSDYDLADMTASLPSDISIGKSTLDDVLAAYGKPTNFYVDDSMIYAYYASDDLNKMLSLYFDFDNKLLDEIEIQDMTSVSGELSS